MASSLIELSLLLLLRLDGLTRTRPLADFRLVLAARHNVVEAVLRPRKDESEAVPQAVVEAFGANLLTLDFRIVLRIDAGGRLVIGKAVRMAALEERHRLVAGRDGRHDVEAHALPMRDVIRADRVGLLVRERQLEDAGLRTPALVAVGIDDQEAVVPSGSRSREPSGRGACCRRRASWALPGRGCSG